MIKRYLSEAFFAVASLFFIIAMIPFAIVALFLKLPFDRPSTNAAVLKRPPDAER